jgi:hypothetical protein
MTNGRLQDLLIIGIVLLIVSCIVIPSLVDEWTVANLQRELREPTVNAATRVTVWTYTNTGLYYCPDSKLYGKVKPGKYTTQEKALETGYRPSGGAVCR